jgi:putative transposase
VDRSDFRFPVVIYTSKNEVLRRPVESAQYASQTYREALEAAGLWGSMSSVGNPYHNAQSESFMKTLKVEEVYRAGYETFADVAARLPLYIELVYNSERLHSALGYRTPEEFEILFAQKAA